MFANEKNFVIRTLFYGIKPTKKDFEEINYEKLVIYCSRQLILPAIYVNLRQKGCLRYLNAQFRRYLKEIYQINYNRNTKLISEIHCISELFQKNNLKHVFLKGSALLIGEFYSDIGERMINDIDILVEEKNIKKVERLMNEFSYHPLKNYTFFQENNKHLHRMTKQGKIFAVEIHKKLFSYKEKYIDLNDMIFNCEKKNSIPIPDINKLHIHNILNSQLNDYGSKLLNYSVKSFYDMYKINLKKANISYAPQGNKHFFRYLFLYNDFLKKENIYFSKLSNLDRLRIRLRSKYNVFSKIEYAIIIFYINVIKYLKFKFNQVYEIILNKDYRSYLKKKLKGSHR